MGGFGAYAKPLGGGGGVACACCIGTRLELVLRIVFLDEGRDRF